MQLKIREIRKERGLTQEALAAKLKSASLRTLGSWERGESMPDAGQLWECCEVLDTTPNDLLGWYDEHPETKASGIETPYEADLVNCFRRSTVQRQASILQTARDAAGMSAGEAECGDDAATAMGA